MYCRHLLYRTKIFALTMKIFSIEPLIRNMEIPDIVEVLNSGKQGFMALGKVEMHLINGKDLTDDNEATLIINVRKMTLKKLNC